MLSALLFAASILAQGTQLSAPPTIRRVEVEGNFRFPERTVLAWLKEAPGKPVTAANLRADLERLHRLGVYRTVEVESRDVSPGTVDLVYRVHEAPFVSAFSFEGVNSAMEELVTRALAGEKLEVKPGTPYRPERVLQAAETVRRVFVAHKYPMAQVEVDPEKNGNLVHVVFRVRPGRRIEIGTVQFDGNKSIPRRELLRSMGKSRPASLLTRWSGTGCYLPDGFKEDLEALRQLYMSRGYAGATVGMPEVVARVFPAHRRILEPWAASVPLKIEVSIPVTEGPLYTARSVRVEGDAKAASPEVSKIVRGLQIPGKYDYTVLESARQKILAALGREGYALARVELDQRFDATTPAVDAIYRISAGDPLLVGRIDFTGNSRLPDKFLRRELRIREGDVYNSSSLDESIKKLNRSGLIQDLRRDDVSIKADRGENTLNLVFKVKEKNRHGIFGTGGTEGVSGGYLGIIYTAFNLFGLGDRLSFELDGGSAQSNALLDLALDHFMGAPFSLGLSFAHRVTGFNASNIVPGPQQIVNFLTMRTTSGAVQGRYQVSSKVGVGLGLQVERDSTLTGYANSGTSGWESIPRSTLQPTFFFDSRGGDLRPQRGVQLFMSPALSAPTPFSAFDTAQPSARLRIYHPDPLSGGRNSLAFQFVGIVARPLGGADLPLERRLFPADELLRGFANGAISPWSYDPSVADASQQLQPVGADTVLGFTTEYRVPIYGPLSGAGFLDLGWTGLSRRSLTGESTANTIVAQTDNLLRASTGGELRLLIPGLHQPVRLIFAWNPLRLHTLFTGAAGGRNLADPARSIRFAFGNVF